MDMTGMCRQIVVMGGSFNPPTTAHQKLMLAAVNALQADMGIYVPSSHEYVRKKMAQLDRPAEVLDADLRLRMLGRMAEDDPRLSVDDYEYHLTEKSHTYDTLVYLQEKYPDAALYFLAGGDKIDVLSRWYRIRDLLERFHMIVTNREDYNAGAALEASPFLTRYRSRFLVIDYPEDIEHISSSAVREMWRAGKYEEAGGMLHPAAYEIMMNPRTVVIDTFRDQYFFLSNFYPAPVTYRGLTYRNNEAAFQAQKCMTEDEKIPFTDCEPAKAKSIGRRVTLRPDWERVKLSFMEEIVYAKFSQNEDLRELLLSTGHAILKEGNTWNDIFWGVSRKTGRGKNHLGKILMRVRDQLGSDDS
ncbi:MAG: nicotinate (nicotinamide) nucleotide adenylyltransferase [Clostridia bacterium]|nr:nicotinate (nicotinamide) nucleotide adenylyltransferase [Clostridia bacterium]